MCRYKGTNSLTLSVALETQKKKKELCAKEIEYCTKKREELDLHQEMLVLRSE